MSPHGVQTSAEPPTLAASRRRPSEQSHAEDPLWSPVLETGDRSGKQERTRDEEREAMKTVGKPDAATVTRVSATQSPSLDARTSLFRSLTDSAHHAFS